MNEQPSTYTGDEPRLVNVALKVDIAVIGAGQAGLSSAYHLQRLGPVPGADFLVFNQSPRLPYGARCTQAIKWRERY